MGRDHEYVRADLAWGQVQRFEVGQSATNPMIEALDRRSRPA